MPDIPSSIPFLPHMVIIMMFLYGLYQLNVLHQYLMLTIEFNVVPFSLELDEKNVEAALSNLFFVYIWNHCLRRPPCTNCKLKFTSCCFTIVVSLAN